MPAPSQGGLIFMKPGKPLSLFPSINGLRESIFKECTQSLNNIHEHGFCHRDLRAANICQFDDRFEVIDFGFATSQSTKHTMSLDCDIPNTWPFSLRNSLESFKSFEKSVDRSAKRRKLNKDALVAPVDSSRNVVINHDRNEIKFRWLKADDCEMLATCCLRLD